MNSPSVYINGESAFDEEGRPLFKWVPTRAEKIDYVKNIDQLKDDKVAEIKSAFAEEVMHGRFSSVSLGCDVDCRRSEYKNDLQNVQGLINIMTAGSVPQIEYIGVTETVPATVSQLTALVLEMQQYGLKLYTKKWRLEDQAGTSKTTDQIKGIRW